ncbi:MAG: glutathione S-transferase family protein [Pseudomonadota bacterium]
MKLYNSRGPNPHVVRMFLAEKGVTLTTEMIDVIGGENRKAPYITNVNRRGQCPALELDDGSHIAEITAICEYIDEKHPNPPLIGSTPEERGETRMWVRRIDLGFCEPMANGFRYSDGHDMFKERIRVVPEAADGLKAIAQDTLGWIDEEIEGRTFVCGGRFTLADIMLFCFVEFGNQRGQPLNEGFQHIGEWFKRVQARPSAGA